MSNRLVVIGNGFDLNAGLPSKYSDYFQHATGEFGYLGDFLNIAYICMEGRPTLFDGSFFYGRHTTKPSETKIGLMSKR